MLLMQWLIWLVLLAAAITTCTIAVAGGVSTDIGRFGQLIFLLPISLFAISPYFFLGWQHLRAKNSVQTVILLVGAILLAGYGISSLYVRLGHHDDALRGLWLLVIPVYQWVACGIIALLFFWLRNLGHDKSQDISNAETGRDATGYDQLPWYRQSTVIFKIIIVGIFFAPALLPACIAVLTGPIYYKQSGEDGVLRKWRVSNKVAAILILVVETYAYASVLLR